MNLPRTTSIAFVSGLLLLAVSARANTALPAQHAIADDNTKCAEQQSLRISGADIRLFFDADDFELSPTQVCAWVERSGLAVGNYFEHFPVRSVRVKFQPVNSTKVVTGTTYGSADGGPLIVIKLGNHADQASLDRDWVMTHEFVHLAVPSVPDRSHWLEEGVATYVEPIARAQLGQLTAEKVWNDMVRDMPQGLPKDGDQGLDRTPTWGRTYWGGALFCLLADVEIRRRTNNQKTLRDALRGVLKAGGNIQEDWSTERVFAAGDKALGIPVLTDLYHRMATMPGVTELDSLFSELGVSRNDGELVYNDDAPLVKIRAGITAAESRNSGERPS